MKKHIAALAAVAAALVLTGGCAKQATTGGSTAEEFPETGKTIELIVPFAPGGTTDVIARALGPALETELGTTVQIVNKEGAGSQIGITALANAKPDGYTIGFTNLPSAIGTYIDEARGAPYDQSSFAPIAIISETENYLAVKKGGTYATFDEVIAAAKAEPKSVNVGIAGDDEKLAIAGIEKATGASFNLVPFDSGADKTTALLGDKVDMIIGGGPTILPQVQAQKFLAIAVVGPDQDVFVPDTPTLGSMGIPVDLGGSLLISAPKGTDAATVDTIANAIQKIVESPEFETAAKNNWMRAAYTGPAASAEAWTSAEKNFRDMLAAS
jgi:putative tricarboxylic transport membrane protein